MVTLSAISVVLLSFNFFKITYKPRIDLKYDSNIGSLLICNVWSEFARIHI